MEGTASWPCATVKSVKEWTVEMSTAHKRTPSSIYSVIPSVVRSRIPVLTSLRQSARDIISNPLSPSRPSFPIDTVTPTAPESAVWNDGPYSAEFRMSRASSTASALTHANVDDHAIIFPAQSQPTAASQKVQTVGVDWDIAGMGVRLWLNARGRADTATCDPAVLRSMHIDAVRYMNMALPSDLSNAEIEAISSSLPVQVRVSEHVLVDGTVVPQPNMLRRGVAQAVCWVVALVLVLIPLLMTMVDKILVYEREHQIAYRVLNSSADITKNVSERGFSFGNAAIRYKDTHLGRALSETVSWLTEGIIGGLNDGLIQSTNGYSKAIRQSSSTKHFS